MGYLYEQGKGQASLLLNARKNEEVLSDKNVSEDVKSKIRKIEGYKKYFFKKWKSKESEIYSKTTLLEQSAVTYLVITSPYSQILAKKECFPFMGCFPYLGFYSLKSAKEYARKMEKEGMISYIRPVYAYSTLGYFTDTILSSFFIFDDFELAELIFHELFHTIFFLKDEVDLNEGLATFFGRKMAIEYFSFSEKQKKDLEEKREKQGLITSEIVSLTKKLNEKYKKVKKGAPRSVYEEIFQSFMQGEFFPRLKEKCGVEECLALKRKWNNASLAAFMTYESDSRNIDKLYLQYGKSLLEFFRFIESEHQKFKNSSHSYDKFSKYLFRDL